MVTREIERIERVRQIVLRHGWNATAYQIINPGIRHHFSTAEDAVTGYVDSGNVRVVAGAPVCSETALATAVDVFESAAREEGKQVCYFGAESRLASLCHGWSSHSSVLLGAQPVWRPAEWPDMLARHSSLRMQVNRARNKGVLVEEWSEPSVDQKARLHACLKAWLATRGLPPMHFLVEPETLEFILDRRICVALLQDAVVAFLVASPVPMRDGWLVEQIVRQPAAPNGTAELLIDSLQRTAAAGSKYITLGLSPLSRRVSAEMRENPIWLRLVLSWARAHGGRFYNFEGLDAFKAKFRPESWEPVYAIANAPRFTPAMLYAIVSAFTNSHVLKTLIAGLSRAAAKEGEWLLGRGRRILSGE